MTSDGSSQSLAGKLLLAMPCLKETSFARRVVYLSEHDVNEGAFGLILNEPTGKRLHHFLEGENFDALRDVPVFVGGPVAVDQVTFASLKWNSKSGLKCQLRISLEKAMRELEQPGRRVHAFLGYSGWSPGQLEGELARRSWHVMKASSPALATDHEPILWKSLMQSGSAIQRILADAPDHPLLN
ncbi:MAG: YqgE/AlgH family protein [Verrucomicrobia bacterium]|nr:MAG: YqgE/AlgH family protein [Verrucomicrobiota bacterium]